MTLFFSSKKIFPVFQNQQTLAFIAERAALPFISEIDKRFDWIVLMLLSEQKSEDIHISEIKYAAQLLQEFEAHWNAPDRTVASATEHTFRLLSNILSNPKMQMIISDKCLSDFFSAVASLNTLLNFDAVNEKQHNLATMCSCLSYVQLALVFFEKQIQPYWSSPADVFFRNIFYLPDGCNPSSYLNRLSCLFLLSEVIFKTIESNRTSVKPNQILFATMKDHLTHIRSLIIKILSHTASPAEELKYLMREYGVYLQTNNTGICVAYIILTTTQIEDLKQSVWARLSGNPDLFHRLQEAYGDTPKMSKALDTDDPDTIDPSNIHILLKRLVAKGDFEAIYNTQTKFECIDYVVKDALLLEDECSGTSLLNDMLTICDKRKPTKAKTLLSSDNVDNISYLNQVIVALFPDVEKRIDFFVRAPLPHSLKHTMLGNFITSQLILLLIFNDTHYFSDRACLPQIFKKKLEQNLSLVPEFNLLFINNFHVLYFLVFKHGNAHPELHQLREDLNLVLEIIREGKETYADILRELLMNELDKFPPEYIEVIRQRLVLELWDAESKRREELADRIFSIPKPKASASGEKELGVSTLIELTAPPSRKPKKKKQAGKTKASIGTPIPISEIGSTDSASDPREVCSKASPSIFLDQERTTPIPQPVVITDTLEAPPPTTRISEETLANLERISKLNQDLLTKLDAFKEAVQSHLRRSPPLAISEQEKFRILEQSLDQRLEIARLLRAYIKKARKAAAINFHMTPLTIDTFLLPDWLEPYSRDHQKSIASLVAILPSIRDDKSCTLSTHTEDLIRVFDSIPIPTISITQLQSFQYLLQFGRAISSLLQEFTPVLIRILSNKDFHPFGEVAVDAKHFGQLLLQVQHWSHMITANPFEEIELKDIPPFEFPIALGPRETFNPTHELQAHLSHLVTSFNGVINAFAVDLIRVLPHELESTFIITMRQLLDKLSHCYFKSKAYPALDELNAIFTPLAKTELCGAQVLMPDLPGDVDLTLSWRFPDDDFSKVVDKIKQALLRAGCPTVAASLTGREIKLDNPDGSSVVSFKIKVPMGERFPLPLDLSIYLGEAFRSESYISHAGGRLYIDTRRIYCPHLFFQDVLNNRLSIHEPSLPIHPAHYDNAKRSELAHKLKLILRSTYSVLPEERLYLNELATAMLELIKSHRSKIIELKATHPHLFKALIYLLEQHFEHAEVTPNFFRRTNVLLAFYKDIGCRLLGDSGGRKLQIIAANEVTSRLQCTQLPDSEILPLPCDLTSNSFLVDLPEKIRQRIDLTVHVATLPSTFFGGPISPASAATRIIPDQEVMVKSASP